MYVSDEEEHFAAWLDELKHQEIILSYEYEPEPFVLIEKQTINWNKQLKTKTKPTEATMFQKLIYTTDFKVEWNTIKSDGVFTYTEEGAYEKRPLFFLPSGSTTTYFEVKPVYDQNNMTRSVRHTIAWVMDKYNVKVEIVRPEKLFKKTFAPDSFFLTPKGKERIKGGTLLREQINSIEQYLEKAPR